MRMTLAVRPSRPCASSSAGAAFFAALSCGFCTRYLTIFLSMRVLLISELPVIAFLQGVKQISGAMLVAVVFDLLVAARTDLGAVLEREHVSRVLQILLLHQHALERLGVEAEGSAAL